VYAERWGRTLRHEMLDCTIHLERAPTPTTRQRVHRPLQHPPPHRGSTNGQPMTGVRHPDRAKQSDPTSHRPAPDPSTNAPPQFETPTTGQPTGPKMPTSARPQCKTRLRDSATRDYRGRRMSSGHPNAQAGARSRVPTCRYALFPQCWKLSGYGRPGTKTAEFESLCDYSCCGFDNVSAGDAYDWPPPCRSRAKINSTPSSPVSSVCTMPAGM
jgi:hypothetical protein